MDSFMRQVEMKSGNAVRVGWIDEALAKVGKHVRDEDDDNGLVWKITQVWTRMTSKALEFEDRARKEMAKKLK